MASTARRKPIRGPGKTKRLDSVLFQPTLKKGENGEPDKRLKPLVDAVLDMKLWYGRAYMVANLSREYGVSTQTVDRAIAAAKDLEEDELKLERSERIRRNYARLEANARAAKKAKKHNAVTQAIREATILAGDRRPDVLLIPNNDQTSAALLAEVERLNAILAAGSKKGA